MHSIGKERVQRTWQTDYRREIVQIRRDQLILLPQREAGIVQPSPRFQRSFPLRLLPVAPHALRVKLLRLSRAVHAVLPIAAQLFDPGLELALSQHARHEARVLLRALKARRGLQLFDELALAAFHGLQLADQLAGGGGGEGVAAAVPEEVADEAVVAGGLAPALSLLESLLIHLNVRHLQCVLHLSRKLRNNRNVYLSPGHYQ
jgi:hypothetical protein